MLTCYSTHTVWINEPDTHLLNHPHCLDQWTRYSSVTSPTLTGSTNQILICYITHTDWINEPDTHLLQHPHWLDQRTRYSSVTALTLTGSTNQILICYSTHTDWINEPDTHLLQHSHCLFPAKTVMTDIADSCCCSRSVRLSRVKLTFSKKFALQCSSKACSSAILLSCTSFVWDTSSCRHRRLNGTKRAAANIHYLTERTGILTEKDNNKTTTTTKQTNKQKTTNKQNKTTTATTTTKQKQNKKRRGGGEGEDKKKERKKEEKTYNHGQATN